MHESVEKSKMDINYYIQYTHTRLVQWLKFILH